jgi:hypothetical protein
VLATDRTRLRSAGPYGCAHQRFGIVNDLSTRPAAPPIVWGLKRRISADALDTQNGAPATES